MVVIYSSRTAERAVQIWSVCRTPAKNYHNVIFCRLVNRHCSEQGKLQRPQRAKMSLTEAQLLSFIKAKPTEQDPLKNLPEWEVF